MRKIMLVIAAAMVATTGLKAQDNGYENKHEVAVSIGIGSNSRIIDDLENAITTIMAGVKYGDEHYVGPFSVEYFYKAKPWLGVGGILAYGKNTQDLYFFTDDDKAAGKIKNNYFTVMPSVKFDWLRKSNFGLYSKLAIGATYRNEKVDYNESTYEDFDESEWHVNWQISAIGVEVGGKALRGFAELGTGEQGILLGGVRYKF